MRPLAAILAAVAAAGCSIPEKQQYPPFGCYQQPLRTMAPDPVMIRGRVVNPVMNMPIPGALIEFFFDGDPVGSVTSGADGSFVSRPRTGGKVFSAYIKVSHVSENPQDPNLDTYFYPATQLVDDLDIGDVQILTGGQATALMKQVNVDLDLTQVMLAITAVDCNGVPQGGATLSTDPKGAPIRYVVDGKNGPVPDLSATVTDQQAGTGFAANLPITDPTSKTSTIMISATMPSPTNTSTILTLRSHPISGARPGALIQAEIQP